MPSASAVSTGSRLSSASSTSTSSTSRQTSATSRTSQDSGVSIGQQLKSNLPDQVDTSKILRFYRVPGTRFKNLDELLKHHGYQIGNKLYEGEFSVLHLAKYTKTGIAVACKQIDLNKTRSALTSREMSRPDATILSYIKNELYMLKRVASPYILKLYFHFVANSTLYIFLKLAPEGNLAKYVCERGPLSETQSLVIFSQMAVVLEYLYSFRITHRDLKLESVLLLSSPGKDLTKLTVMITNFGASRQVTVTKEQPGLCYTSCGGFDYIAPEVLDNKSYNPFLVDIWMAGVTLYAMLSGTVPFAKEDSKTQLRAQCERSWKWPHTFKPSANLNALMSAILQPDPAARIRVEALVAHVWVASEYKRALRRVPTKSAASGGVRPGASSLVSNRSKGSASSKKSVTPNNK